MQYVFQLNADRTPMQMLSAAEARRLMRDGVCAVFRRFPFTLIHKVDASDGLHPEYRLKISPGSKVSGLAILEGDRVVWAAEIEHRGFLIRDALLSRRSLRRTRRSRKTRYRQPRFLNRRRKEQWIPPSLNSRVENIRTWVNRLMRLCPITTFSMMSIRFDTQKLENPEISGVEYQQGTLFGYEVKEYLLEKWKRTCAYCDAKVGPFEVEHIVPKSKGGSNRVGNLSLACRPCNVAKGNRPAAEFLQRDPAKLQRILACAKRPLPDPAAVNITRRYIYRVLAAQGLTIECSSGGMTKFNRHGMNLPKTHWIDAACTGASTPKPLKFAINKPLLIKATGYGNRQFCQVYGNGEGYEKLKQMRSEAKDDPRVKHPFAPGFRKRTKDGTLVKPRSRQKFRDGFRTGDMVVANIPSGKYQGKYTGRITIRMKGSFSLKVGKQNVDVHPKYCKVVHRMDGYSYAVGQPLELNIIKAVSLGS